MRKICLFIATLALLTGVANGQQRKMVLDSNTAFYEGENLRYILPSPPGFKMVTDEAINDGYSMAFIPNEVPYDSATIIIGINIYKIRGITFDSVIANDTTGLRKHYGKNLSIRSVLPLRADTGDPLTTFYLEADRTFVPNRVMAYFNGGTEMVIFELVISPDILRFQAEKIFADVVHSFRPLKRGTLGQK
ncbi:MAG: hypothetical protein WAU88_00990 [Candidatus Zixiibacteriota bacterium]